MDRNVKAWTEIGGKVAEIIALAVGAIWAYNRFIRQREEWPRATIQHHIRHFDLPDGRRILRVTERIKNSSPVLIQICERRTTVQQILPLIKGPLSLSQTKRNTRRAGSPWVFMSEMTRRAPP